MKLLKLLNNASITVKSLISTMIGVLVLDRHGMAGDLKLHRSSARR